MNFRSAQISFILLIALASPCLAVHWTGSQTAPETWTYTLQIDPEDNFNISQATTTITMTGLAGVTAAGPPTSSDFPNPIGSAILAWTPQVLNGGTTVVWSITGGGTGNFATVQHVFGFTVTAPGAANGSVSFSTNGFQVDDDGPKLDISGTGGRACLGISGDRAGSIEHHLTRDVRRTGPDRRVSAKNALAGSDRRLRSTLNALA